MLYIKHLRPIFLAMLLIASAGMLLSVMALRDVAQQMLQIFAFIAGTAFFSGISLLFGIVNQPRSAPFIQVTFNSNQLREDLSKVIDAEYREIDTAKFAPWEPRPEVLVNDDPSFALAKVRIDLEREIRRLSLETGVLRSGQRFNMPRAIEALRERELLPKEAIVAIRDILPICNRAIHGEEIDTTTAQSVIEIASEVMVILQGEVLKTSG